MKWLVFTGACVVALVSLGVLAVDARNVHWEVRADGPVALCPYCRTEVHRFATVCAQCRRAIDWDAHNDPCRWCLEREDVELLKDRFTALELDEGPLPGDLARYPRAYFLDMEEGACTYCAGLGKVVEGSNGTEVNCPVCRGDGRCVACGGDRVVVTGDESAASRLDQRQALWRRALRREAMTHLPLKRALLVDEDVDLLRGYREAEQIEDEEGKNLLERARERIEGAFAALDSALQARAATLGAASPSGS